MKKIISIAMMLTGIHLAAQTYQVTPSGLRDKDATDQTFLVIDVPGKTAAQLYENAMKYVNVTYKTPEYAIKGNVANEYLKFETYAPDFLIVEHMGAKYTMSASYTTELNFKDGKVKFEFLNIKMGTGNSDSELLFTQETVGVGIAIYNKKLELKKPELKTDLETYYNKQVTLLSDYLFERSASDKW